MLRTLKLTIAYDGTNYVGWQRQINGQSIQQIIEEAFVPLLGAAPTVVGAGRTDAGVHALEQVASVNLESTLRADAVLRALNVRLPADIRVRTVVDAPLGFHARFRAVAKSYRYRIVTAPVLSPFERWFVWHAPHLRYDIDAMRAAANRLIGRHDFASFQARGSSIVDTVRTVHRLDIEQRSDEIVIEMEGDGFLRAMVRGVAGTLVEVASGARSPESIDAILTARDRQAAGPSLPPQGLTLIGVKY